MKKTLAIAALLSLSTLTAQATTYWDFDLFDNQSIGIQSGSSYSNTFNISVSDGFAEAGYDPITEQIVSAKAIFSLGSVGFGHRCYEVDLDGSDFASGSYGVFFVGGTLPSGPVTGSALMTLDQTGSIGYEIKNTGNGGVSLLFAKLWAETEARPSASVPDAGATASMLGLSLIGLFVARRRLA